MAMETSGTGLFWAGWAVSGLVILFLTFDGGTKVLQVTPVLEACARLGLGPRAVLVVGGVLLACTALYAAPATAVLGAILLTAFLGGAVATHVRGGSGVVEIVFAVATGGLVWLGLVLRDPALLWIIVMRR